MKAKFQIFNQFVLKIIAILCMTLDHIGIMLLYYTKNPTFGADAMYTTGYIFRVFGRLSFPLIVMMLVEGIIHTRCHWKYILRIGIITFSILLFQVIVSTCFSSTLGVDGSPFIDLFLLVVIFYLLYRKDKYSYLAILPILYFVFASVVEIYERWPIDGIFHAVEWLPIYLRPAYSLFGLGLGLGFYYSYVIAEKQIRKSMKLEDDTEVDICQTSIYRRSVNLWLCVSVVIANVILYVLGNYVVVNGFYPFDVIDFALQNYSLLVIPFFILYNGERGYNKNWFKYGCYLYFPVHIIIIYLIFYVLFM